LGICRIDSTSEVSERICEFRKNHCADTATKATRAVIRFYHGNPEWAKSQAWFEGLLSAAQAEGIKIDEQLSNAERLMTDTDQPVSVG